MRRLILAVLAMSIILLGACIVPTEPLSPTEAPTPSVPAPSIEPAPTITEEEETTAETEEELSLPGCPEQPEGSVDPDIVVDIYDPEKAYNGTTLIPDNHNSGKPRIIEVNMSGEIVWEYQIPQNLKQYTNPGFDAEVLPDNNILFILPRKGIYEIDRDGNTVWSYLTSKVSHDADRLSNGNTIFVFGANDRKDDAQVTEVNPEGEIVWAWYAKDYFDKSPYKDIDNEGWTHTNAVTRMTNGNTLISPRNFDLMVEVDAQGTVLRTIGEEIFSSTHDPEVQPDGNILAVSQWRGRPHKAIEINPETGEVVWEYTLSKPSTFPIRDANRLPNGNTLITGTTEIVEVTTEGEIVWRLKLKDIVFPVEEAAALGFYKAERICRSE